MNAKKTTNNKWDISKINDDLKTNYIVKTLSRTKRKDYENYVVNAIWNRLQKKIRPVTQQYVSAPNDKQKHYFIDLYFPSINLGIECDEGHHKSQIEADRLRELTIYDELHKLSLNNDYIPKHIYVTLPFDKIEEQINDVVKEINKMAEGIDLEDDWKVLSAVNYFSNKDVIHTSDMIVFKTHKEINKTIFNTISDQKGGYIPKYFKSHPFFKDCMIWYPKLFKESNNQKWKNTLSSDGLTIVERSENFGNHDKEGLNKIVFAKDKDILNNKGYKFVGMFEFVDYSISPEGHTWTYKKYSDECPIYR